jgi:hypothetical protein
MNLESRQLTPNEVVTTNSETDDTSWEAGNEAIGEKIERIKVMKKKIADIMSWGDITVSDREIINQSKLDIDEMINSVDSDISHQATILFNWIEGQGQIISERLGPLSASEIIGAIKLKLKESRSGVLPNMNTVTRTNGLREKATSLAKQVADFYKILHQESKS